jgi:hypothetical protein
VLKRDGTNVVQGSDCSAQSGHWVSVYDGEDWDSASDLQIDHLVPLKEAWVSGAASWYVVCDPPPVLPLTYGLDYNRTTARRQSFANDLTRPQLIAVTGRVNQAKGDKDPAEWLPPLTTYHCTYARAWVTVKHYYGLTVNEEEFGALQSILDSC